METGGYGRRPGASLVSDGRLGYHEAVRILHTSDWHLGISTGPEARVEEQGWFLEWLSATLCRYEVDVLVVAGDIFDTMQPSAEARELYYRFLAQVAQTGVRDVVVVGGNHDSASHLDAPRALLEAVGVHVIGGVPGVEERLDRMVVPLRVRGSEEVAAVCLAVPYVHEYRLGIRTSDLNHEATRAAFRTAFAKIYSSLADHAQNWYPGVPLIATGHMTLGRESKREDYPQEIHQVGNIEGLPVEILDPRISYAALGHIHRCYRVADSAAWYCGTPISYSLSEMRGTSKVLLVDMEAPLDANVQRLEVPRWRDLVSISGGPEDVVQEIESLRWSTKLPPLVHVRVGTNMAEPGLARRLHDAVEKNTGQGGRPVLVEVQERAIDSMDAPSSSPLSMPALDELDPAGVFRLMCDAQNLSETERIPLLAAFTEVQFADEEAMLSMLRTIGEQ